MIRDEIEIRFAAYHKSDEWYQALVRHSSPEQLVELNKQKLAELHLSVPKIVFTVNKITEDPNDPWNNLIDTDRTLSKEAREFDRGSRGKK